MQSVRWVTQASVIAMAAVAWNMAYGEGWQLEGGWVHQWGGKMQISGPQSALVHDPWRNVPWDMPGITPETRGGRPTLADIGPVPTYDLTTPYARFFNDGYVRPDIWTTDQNLGDRSYMTSWWVLPNANQYNPDLNTLQYHILHSPQSAQKTVTDTARVVTERRVTQKDEAVSGGDDFNADGIQLTAKRELKHWGNWQVDLNVGLAWFPNVNSAVWDTPFRMSLQQNTFRRTSTYLSSVSTDYTETYTYSDYARITYGYPPLDVPYAGPANPMGDGAGPLIPILPSGIAMTPNGPPTVRDELVGTPTMALLETRTWTIADQVGMNAELNRLRLAVGPALSRPVTERLSLYLTPQLTLNCVQADVTRQETLTATETTPGRPATTTQLATRFDHGDKTDFVGGLLLAAGADYRFLEHWLVGAYLGREWLAREVTVSVGPDKAHFDLGGSEFSLYLGRHF